MIFERDRMKCKAIISESDADWSTLKSLRNRVNSTLRNDKEIFYRNLINKNQDPKDAWKAINSILGRKQPKPIINNLKLENEDIVGPEEVWQSNAVLCMVVVLGPSYTIPDSHRSDIKFYCFKVTLALEIIII